MNPVTGVALGRLALGVGAFARPDLAAGAFQLDARANPQLPYMTRLFATREIALGALTLLAPGSARRNLTMVGIAVDAADAAAGYLGMASGQVSRKAGLGMIVPALGAVVAGLGGLRQRA